MVFSCLVCGQAVPFSFSWNELIRLAPFRREVLPPVHHWLCPDCQGEMEWTGAGCVRCSKSLEEHFPPLNQGVENGGLCYDCQHWLRWEEEQLGEPVLAGNVSAIRYNRWGQELLTRYKFRGDERLKYVLAALMVHHPASQPEPGQRFSWKTSGINCTIELGVPGRPWEGIRWSGGDLVTAIPLSRTRLLERGFNQAHGVAELVARHWGKPYIPNLLIRKDDEQKQSKRDRRERLAKMFHLFVNNPEHEADIKNKRIVLIDDIYTTGATLHAAAYALRRAGARMVVGYTIAR